MDSKKMIKDIRRIMRTIMEAGISAKIIGQPTMVAIDGGFVVLFGNTVVKYDKDMNAVKQVSMDLDVDGIQKTASKLAEKYADQLQKDMEDMMEDVMPSAPATPPSPAPAQ